MKMNEDPNWLKKMAEKEDGCDVSVGLPSTDKYAERAQEIDLRHDRIGDSARCQYCNQNSYDTSVCKVKLARALEQAALEARMIGFAHALDLVRVYRGTGELTARCEAELEQLRSRLAKLRQEARKASDER